MVTALNRQVTQKITVTVPTDVVERLDELIAPRQRSQFIVAAIERQIALSVQVVVLEETAGAWKDENHPGLQTPADIDRWLDDLRQGRLPRSAAAEKTTNGDAAAR